MKVLILTTSRNVKPRNVKRWRDQMALGPGTQISIVALHPPKKTLPVARVESAEPSLVPWRPVVPIQGSRTRSWGGSRRLLARALRLARRPLGLVQLPRISDDSVRLAIACRTSRTLRSMAAESDLVVSAHDTAALAAWHLSQRVSEPIVVNGPGNVPVALQRLGRATAPSVHTVQMSEGADRSAEVPQFPDLRGCTRGEARLLIAPANFAGQAQGWAKAVRTHTNEAALNMRAGKMLANPFPTDVEVTDDDFNDLRWRLAWRSYVMENFTHIIVEANRPVLGNTQSGFGERHAEELIRAGKKVALLSHGSDARIPSVHAKNERWHSYDALPARNLRDLEIRSRHNTDIYNSFSGTVFVSTPALRTFVPEATWLPLVVDADVWATSRSPLEHGGVPVVAHIPSSAQKGSHMIDPILREMEDKGLITYLRVQNVPHNRMPALYQSADIMVEQFGIADYSAAACEAMAAGCVVVSRVSEHARDTVLKETGRELPVVEANPDTLEEVIMSLARDSERSRAISEQGRSFVREIHDGRRSAEIIQEWLRA